MKDKRIIIKKLDLIIEAFRNSKVLQVSSHEYQRGYNSALDMVYDTIHNEEALKLFRRRVKKK